MGTVFESDPPISAGVCHKLMIMKLLYIAGILFKLLFIVSIIQKTGCLSVASKIENFDFYEDIFSTLTHFKLYIYVEHFVIQYRRKPCIW